MSVCMSKKYMVYIEILQEVQNDIIPAVNYK